MNTPTSSAQNQLMWPWRPLYWEPVSGTGERLMVGVLFQFQREFKAIRTMRDDVLDCLFGKSAKGLRKLIDHSLNLYQVSAQAAQTVEIFNSAIAGVWAGPLKVTEANSAQDILQTACLLFSSLGNLDKLDDAEESDAPQQEEVNKRFSSEVRDEVVRLRPDLVGGFGQSSVVVSGGIPVRFGYFSPRAVLHFTVLNATRQSASVRDARARIFELERARDIGGIQSAALICAVPRDDDATLGPKQRDTLRLNRDEIERNADAKNLRWYAVHTASAAAERVIELAG